MATVTQRIKYMKFPRGGIIKPSEFKEVVLSEKTNPLDYKAEGIHPVLMGTVIEIIAKLDQGIKVEDAFSLSKIGAELVGKLKDYKRKIKTIKKRKSNSIEYLNAAFNLGRYVTVYRMGSHYYDKKAPDIELNEEAYSHVLEMKDRCIKFFERYGSIGIEGFNFEGAYTNKIHIGEGDFTTHDTLWDMKVSVSKFNHRHALQLLVYFIMGSVAKLDNFHNIKYLGIFNPRLNIVWRIKLEEISDEVIDQVISQVIGYEIKE